MGSSRLLLLNLSFQNKLSHSNQRKRLSSLRLLHLFQINPTHLKLRLSLMSKNSSRSSHSNIIATLLTTNPNSRTVSSLSLSLNLHNPKVIPETTTRIDRSTSIKINRTRVTTSTKETTIKIISRVTTTKVQIIKAKSITTTRVPRIKTIITIVIQILKSKARVS